MKVILILALTFLAFGCNEIKTALNETPSKVTSGDTTVASSDVTPAVVKPTERIALYWENTSAPHPERKPWSDYLVEKVKAKITTYDKANDVTELCPKYKSLNTHQKLKLWGEFWVALCSFESSYKPTSASVDVGTQENKDTWSIGLFQMSVVDIKNYRIQNMSYKYDDLLKPLPNIDLATTIMAHQIEKKGGVFLASGVYWAPLKIGGKYTRIKEIKALVKARVPACF